MEGNPLISLCKRIVPVRTTSDNVSRMERPYPLVKGTPPNPTLISATISLTYQFPKPITFLCAYHQSTQKPHSDLSNSGTPSPSLSITSKSPSRITIANILNIFLGPLNNLDHNPSHLLTLPTRTPNLIPLLLRFRSFQRLL